MSIHSLNCIYPMARPRSEDKQIALLDAATEVIAAQGLGVPTSLIAKRAGVAEGTLFRYFATKDDLLNAVYLYQCHNAAEASRVEWDESAPQKDQLELMWNEWIDWGVAHPDAFSTTLQLEVSDKLTAEAREEGRKLCGNAQEVFDNVAFAGLPNRLAGDFYDAIATAIAQATVNFVIRHPEHAKACKAAAFNMTWSGLNGE